MTGLASSCIPKGFPNPALNGPVWGPGAPTNTAAIPSAPETPGPSPVTPYGSASPATGSSSLSLGGAAALGAGGVIVLVAVFSGVYFLWKRNAWKKLGGSAGTHDHPPMEMQTDYGALVPQEIQGEGIHELETGDLEIAK